MSHISPTVTNEFVIPTFETELFKANPDAVLACGIIAVGANVTPGLETVYDNYLRLRGAVYSLQTNMISEDLLRDDGSEVDDDDARSVHIAVVENKADAQRIVGSIRIIEKSAENPAPLPIEDFFGDVFDDPDQMKGVDISQSSPVEISRYICRHEDPKIQRTLKWPMFKAVVGHIMNTGANPTYAVVEEFLERDLSRNGVLLHRIADPKFVPEYNDANLAVTIDIPDLASKLGITANPAASSGALNFENFTFIEPKGESQSRQIA